jgi:non-specific protein-tyrosine kinase
MESLIEQLLLQFDLILLDTPAILVVADAALLAPIVDGVALVVRRNFIREEAVKETCRQLENIKACMVGLIINDAEKNGSYYYYRQR